MKRSALATAFLLLLAAASARFGASQPNLVRELAPGVWTRIAEPEKRIIANTSWIAFRDFVVVIDANFPWGARAALADLKRTVNKPVRYVFDTHYHGDHAFGNSVWVDAGATIVCSDDCLAESRAKNTPSWSKDAGTGGYSLKAFRLEHPQLSFRDGMAIDDGERRLELRKVGPAHTRGDAVAWLPRERILFTGDVAVNRPGNFVGDPDADPENWVKTLEKLASHGPAQVVPGHGAVGTADALRGNAAYLADMLRQVRAAAAAGVPADKLAVELKKHDPWGQDETRNRDSARLMYGWAAKNRK